MTRAGVTMPEDRMTRACPTIRAGSAMPAGSGRTG
jgi:hypothetical protein